MITLACPRCGVENRRVRRYCRECGSLLDFTCPRCGFPNDPGDRFCGGCGIALEHVLSREGLEIPPPLPQEAPLQPHPLPVEPSQLESQHRVVTLVMADLSGFTAMSETMDAEQVTRVMNRVFERLVPHVHRLGGHVDKYVGDMVIAVFGAPKAQEDGPERAVRTALHMREELARLNAEGVARGHTLGISIGVGTGEVVVGYVGAGEVASYTVTGEAFTLTEQLEKIAERGEVMLCQRTYQRVEGLFRIEPRGSAEVLKGEPAVAIYNVVDFLPWVDRLERNRTLSLFPFLDREEQRSLEEAWERVGRGEGQAIAVVGERGLGKTRLLAEVRARMGGPPWLVGHCLSFQQEVPLSPLQDWLRCLSGVPEATDPDHLFEGMRRWLQEAELRADLFLPRLESAFFASLFSPSPAEMERAAEAWLALVDQASRRREVVVVIEDLHWADALTLKVAHHLAEMAPQRRLLLLVTQRPSSSSPTWPGASLPLAPLSQEQVILLLRTCLPEASQHLSRALWEWSEGNPFLLEEWVRVYRSLRSQGWDEEQFLQEGMLHLPDGIREWALAEMDALPPSARYVLQAAAIGAQDQTVGLDALHYVCGSLPDYQEALRALEEARIWSLVSGPSPQAVFHHRMLVEAIRQTMFPSNAQAFQTAFQEFARRRI